MIRWLVGVALLIAMGMAGQLLATSVAVLKVSQGEDVAILTRTMVLDRGNPDALSLLAARSQVDTERLVALQTLVDAEPRRGDAWGHLFQEKVRTGQVDEEALHALLQSTTWAPYEPVVLYQQVKAGMDSWFQLDPAHRRLVVDAGSRVLQSRAVHLKDESVAVMQRTGLLQMSCSQFEDNPACSVP